MSTVTAVLSGKAGHTDDIFMRSGGHRSELAEAGAKRRQSDE